MADLRKTMHGMLRDYGHDVLLQRRKPQEYNGPHPEVEYEATLERHTTRSVFGRSAGAAGVADERPEGLVHSVDMVYYFLWDVDPQDGDRIYEMDERFVNKQSTWVIDYAYPMRGKGGRVEYWVAGVTREGPD